MALHKSCETLPDYHQPSQCNGLNSSIGCGDNNIIDSDNSWAGGTGCRIAAQDDSSLTFGCGNALFHSVGSNTVALKSFGPLNLNRYVPVPHMPLGGNLIEQKQIGTLLHLQDRGPGRKHYISTISYIRRNESGEPEETGSWSYIPQRPTDWQSITTNNVDKEYFPYPVVQGNVNLSLYILANHLSVSDRFRNIIPIKTNVSWDSTNLPKSFTTILYNFRPQEILHLNFGIMTWQDEKDVRIVVQIQNGTWLPGGQCMKLPEATLFVGNDDCKPLTKEKRNQNPDVEFEYSDRGLCLKYKTENENVLSRFILEGFLEINIVPYT